MKEELTILFATISKLQDKFKHHNKKFTLDGKLVGDIGEVLVAEKYGLTLYHDNTRTHDGYVTLSPDKEVQIKASFNNYFYFTKNLDEIPLYFIAVNLYQDGTFEEIYNGSGTLIYNKLLSHLPSERQYNYRLSVTKLKELNRSKENLDKVPIL
ncbi:MAG: hypothetical protein J0G96_06740 [Flavobacteriia bacterium]|nr:hypothetical protein [Flavobacteriia bacterium]OJX39154.1 MAG: hypothetical protein BGO87_03995 [Flavobacteriia bacterium 40-80]